MVTAEREQVVTFELRGGNRLIFEARDPEILVEGMAGTGKTRTILELINALCHRFPGMRAVIVRKVRDTLATTALVTFEKKVLRPGDGVVFFGGSKHEPAAYRYPNGSQINVGGMDNAEKILSSEYDLVYPNEAPELSIEDWETLMSRLRNGVLPNPRIIGDCNPTFGAHWLNKRCEAGVTRRIVTRLEDNPEYYHRDGTPTEAGLRYLVVLDRLTGSRYQRFRLGQWTGVENSIYGTFDRDRQVVDLEEGLTWQDGALGSDWGRVHKAAGVAITKDQYGRAWVREAWAKPDVEHGETTASESARLIRSYGLKKVGGDPNADPLLGLIKSKANRIMASVAEGSRQHRIDLTGRYMRVFTGGAVPSLQDEMQMRWPVPVPGRPDSYGLLFVKGAPGIEEMCDQIEAYHFEHKVSDTKDDMVVVRLDEDLVAGLENGIWALDEMAAPDYSQPLPPVSVGWEKPRVAR